MGSAKRRALINLAFAAATVERQSQHHGSYRYVCEIGGELVFTHSRVGNLVRAL